MLCLSLLLCDLLCRYDKQNGILHREQTDLEQEMKTVQEKHIGSSGFLNPKYVDAPEDRRLAVRHLKNRIDLLRVSTRETKSCIHSNSPFDTLMQGRTLLFKSMNDSLLLLTHQQSDAFSSQVACQVTCLQRLKHDWRLS